MGDRGRRRYSAPSGFKDDTVDALALAAHVAEQTHGDVGATARLGGSDHAGETGRSGDGWTSTAWPKGWANR